MQALILSKSMSPENRAYLELHIAVLLFGFTAILGDIIQLPALIITWWRVLLTSLSMLLLIRVRRLFREMARRKIIRFLGIGVLVSLHWLTFYSAIKLSNASITLTALATASFFTSLIEPLLTRQRIKAYEIGLGLFILPGMLLVAQNTDLAMLDGLAMGLLSAVLAATFTTLNKKHIGDADEKDITFLELGSAFLFLSLMIPFVTLLPGDSLEIWPRRGLDWVYLIVLALLCTTLAYLLALRSLQHLSAFASTLTINLEPVYGIILAWWLLDDHKEVSGGFYLGVLIILAAVFSYPVLKRRMEDRKTGK